jgi:hypothetical protein
MFTSEWHDSASQSRIFFSRPMKPRLPASRSSQRTSRPPGDRSVQRALADEQPFADQMGLKRDFLAMAA